MLIFRCSGRQLAIPQPKQGEDGRNPMSTTTVKISDTGNLVRDKAVRLFTYLKELTELRSDVRRDCDEYDQVVWWAEIPREKECCCAAWDLGRDAAYDDWLRVERPRRGGRQRPHRF